VPRILGRLDDIDAFAMERVPGRPDFDGVPDADRDTVADEYLQQLTRLHALDVEPFVEAGARADPKSRACSCTSNSRGLLIDTAAWP
jgi:aminoglycoside phosphotransferase